MGISADALNAKAPSSFAPRHVALNSQSPQWAAVSCTHMGRKWAGGGVMAELLMSLLLGQ